MDAETPDLVANVAQGLSQSQMPQLMVRDTVNNGHEDWQACLVKRARSDAYAMYST